MRSVNSLLRTGILSFVCSVSIFGQLLLVNPAGGQISSASSGKTNGASGQHTLSELAPGLLILGGTIAGNGPDSGRSLDSSQATAFLQAWLPDSVFGSPPYVNPPPTLPVYDVQVEDEYLGSLSTMTVYYASDGKSAWISMPPQSLWPGVVVTQQRWIQAPDRTVAAFEGHLSALPVPTGSSSSSHSQSATDSNASLSTAWILLIAGMVVIAAAIALMVIRRRRSGPNGVARTP
jgi:hypothetical protein